MLKFLRSFRIPRGPYCYGKKICPYWEKIEGLHDQENGYCHYLKRGDIDTNNDPNLIFSRIDKNGEIIEYKSAPDMPFPVGLLWDQVKACNIKEEYFLDSWEYKIKPFLKSFLKNNK